MAAQRLCPEKAAGNKNRAQAAARAGAQCDDGCPYCSSPETD